MASYHSAIELWSRQLWNNDYYCATTTSQGLYSSGPGDMDHECRDIEMMDLDDPMEVTTNPLPSSFILDYTLRQLSLTGHHSSQDRAESRRTTPDVLSPRT
jgi:hypothetical protein